MSRSILRPVTALADIGGDRWRHAHSGEVTARFPMDSDSFDEAVGYLENRSLQVLADGFRPTFRVDRLVEDGVEWGLRAGCVSPDGREHQTFYVYRAHRGRGHLTRHAARDPTPFITVPDCNVEAWLERHGVAYTLAGRHTLTREYQAVARFYGDRRAARSRLFLMNHVDEGIAVLRGLGAGERAERAFCLHPLVQADADLAASYPTIASLTDDPHVLTLALEYRNVANAYLSHRHVDTIAEIRLSPLAEVNLLLSADKIQNYKDFLLHHQATHPRSAELTRYFQLWLERLGVTRDAFARWFAALQLTPTPRSLPAGT
jgi:hypothetical protein